MDRNAEHLEIMRKLIAWLNEVWDARMTITAHTHHRDALPGAKFVVNATEVGPREGLWESDYTIPLKYGLRQPLCRERRAWWVRPRSPERYAHPGDRLGHGKTLSRRLVHQFHQSHAAHLRSVHRHSRIKVVGLCHQLGAGYAMVGKALQNELDIIVPEQFISTHASPKYSAAMGITSIQAQEKIKITAAGVNHFTWMLAVRDRETGADLYPLFRDRWAALPEEFEPLSRRVFDAFGYSRSPGMSTFANTCPGSATLRPSPGRSMSWSFMNGIRIAGSVMKNGWSLKRQPGRRWTPRSSSGHQ